MRRRDEVLVGVFTTVAVIIAVLASVWLIRGGLEAGYPLHSRFTWGAGVKQGQPVWLVGVTVGFVDDVELDPRGTLVVTYRIQKDYRVPITSVATIVPNGFFGDMAIALTPAAPSDSAYAPGDTIPVGPGNTGLATLTARADTLTAGLTQILNAIRQQLVDSGGLAELRRTMSTANRVLGQFGDIARTQSVALQSTMSTVRSRIAAVDSARVDSAVRSLQATAANLSVLTGELRVATDRVNRLMAKADTGGGAIGKLMNDPALYEDLRRVMARVDSVIMDLKQNPRKYLKFSVF